jgi:hypothetical protein
VKQDRSAATKILATSVNKTVDRMNSLPSVRFGRRRLCARKKVAFVSICEASRIKGEDVTATSCYDICKP